MGAWRLSKTFKAMNKFVKTLAVAIAMATCTIAHGKEINEPLNYALKLQNQKPMLRAMGDGLSSNATLARLIAIGTAKAVFANQLCCCVEECLMMSGYKCYDSTLIMGSSTIVPSNAYDIMMLKLICQSLAENTTTIHLETKSASFSDVNKLESDVEVYACIEYNGTITDLAAHITEQITMASFDNIGNIINLDAEQFRYNFE